MLMRLKDNNRNEPTSQMQTKPTEETKKAPKQIQTKEESVKSKPITEEKKSVQQ